MRGKPGEEGGAGEHLQLRLGKATRRPRAVWSVLHTKQPSALSLPRARGAGGRAEAQTQGWVSLSPAVRGLGVSPAGALGSGVPRTRSKPQTQRQGGVFPGAAALTTQTGLNPQEHELSPFWGHNLKTGCPRLCFLRRLLSSLFSFWGLLAASLQSPGAPPPPSHAHCSVITWPRHLVHMLSLECSRGTTHTP